MLDIYAERPLAGYTIYCMAKAAQAAMTRSLALELGPDIRVNGIAPGAVMWPSEGKSEAEKNEMFSRTPLNRAGTPEDVANAVLWLLRDAHYVTGHVIPIDGGRLLSL
jgi:pteridine reductase